MLNDTLRINIMKPNVNERSEAAAVTSHDLICPFILELQNASEIPQLLRLLLQQFQERGNLKLVELAYRAGILLESVTLNNKNEITRKSINTSFLPDSPGNFNYQLTKTKFVMSKQLGGYFVRMKLQFGDTITWIKEKELLQLAHIFFNQVFLILKIKNYEFHSVKDDITSAYNQNYLKAFLQNEIERSKRYASVFSVIFFDLDNLKAVNEKYGHLIGTELLKEVAAVLRSQVRKMDLLSRFGGDEFVIVLLHAETQSAYEVCNRIKDALKKARFLKGKDLGIDITGCFGIASYPGDGNSVDELIRKADVAMYEVKHTGKNGIKIYEGDK